MARLPKPGGDEGDWGDILNKFLLTSHAPDGSLKPNSVTLSHLRNDSVTLAKLSTELRQQIEDAANSTAGQDGTDGREVELNTSPTHIQWRHVGDSSWTNLAALADITGPQGVKGDTGPAGPAADASTIDTLVSANIDRQSDSLTLEALNKSYRTSTTVAEFGARGDGDTDDTSAIQAAIDSVATTGGGIIYFQPGTYKVTNTIEVTTSNTRLDFGSARIAAAYSGVIFRVRGTSSNKLTGVSITGGMIDLMGVGATGIAVNYADAPIIDANVRNAPPSAYAAAAVSLSNCSVPTAHVRAETVGTGVALVASTGAEVTAIVRNAYRDGVNVYDGSDDATIRAIVLGYNTRGENGRGGIQVYGSNRVSVLGPRVDSGTSAGTDDSPKVRFRDAQGCSISGGVLTGSSGGSGGISVTVLSDIGTGGGDVSISGVTILGVASYGIQVAAGVGGDISTLGTVSISGCTIKDVTKYSTNSGYGINAGPSTVWSSVTGNTISNCDGEGIVTSSSATITGNTIRNVGGGEIGSRCGVFITGGASVISGNSIIDDREVKLMNFGVRVYDGAVAHFGSNRVGAGYGGTYWIQGNARTELSSPSGSLGFFGGTPAQKPTGVAVDAASIHAALTSLGLIS